MKVFFQLYPDYADIAIAEALAVTQGKRLRFLGNEILIADVPHARFDRLGLSHAAFELLFVCSKKILPSIIRSTNFQKHYRNNFKVTVHHESSEIERKIAKQVADRIKNSKAKMKNPASWFHFFFLGNKVIAGKLLWQNEEDFQSRKVHRWPAPHPTGTNPQLARAMINLTEIPRGELVDPFCGAGGILIEAGFLGLKPVGYDIEPVLLLKATKNLRGYGIKNFKLEKKDARTLSNKISYLVADLPYGRNTPKKGLEQLYIAFLKQLKKILTKRAVLGFPSNIPYKPLIKKAKLKIKNDFSWVINRRLKRSIVVVEP